MQSYKIFTDFQSVDFGPVSVESKNDAFMIKKTPDEVDSNLILELYT